jgi:hypothetical protein
MAQLRECITTRLTMAIYRERAPRRSMEPAAQYPRPSLFCAVETGLPKRSVVNRKSCATRTPAPTWLARPSQRPIVS